jgi:hypothetical protein
MDAYLAANQALWDTWTSYHIASQFYNVTGFKATFGKDFTMLEYACQAAPPGI